VSIICLNCEYVKANNLTLKYSRVTEKKPVSLPQKKISILLDYSFGILEYKSNQSESIYMQPRAKNLYLASGINKTSKLLPVRAMQQPFDQKFILQQVGTSTFLSPQQGEKFKPIVHQWHTSLAKLRQKCDRGRVKRNWLEGLSIDPGLRGLLFFQLVYWLEQKKIPLLPSLLAFCWWSFTSLEIYPERAISKKHSECSSAFDNIIVVPIVDVPSNVKPRIYQRLQELAIPCWRTRDGNIWVEISNVNIAVIVHRTIQQSVAQPQEIVELLQNCWNKNLT